VAVGVAAASAGPWQPGLQCGCRPRGLPGAVTVNRDGECWTRPAAAGRGLGNGPGGNLSPFSHVKFTEVGNHSSCAGSVTV
jgi:hypothetical protein